MTIEKYLGIVSVENENIRVTMGPTAIIYVNGVAQMRIHSTDIEKLIETLQAAKNELKINYTSILN